MRRIAVQIAYFVRSAFRGLRTSSVATVVAIVTIGVSLVLVGAFGLLLRNMEDVFDAFGDELHVTAYLDDGLSADGQRSLAAAAATVEGVESVRIVSKEQALERFREGVGGGGAYLEGLSGNPLPASIEVTLLPASRSARGLAVVVGALDGYPGISDMASGRDWVEGYLRAVALVRGVGTALAVILALAALLIVANTIRLGVYTRRDELEILSLVGASRTFIHTPFILEGILQGAAGGTLAVVVLFALFHLTLPGFEFGQELMLGGITPRFFSPTEALVLVGGGAGLGLFGSAAALTGDWRA